MCTGCMWNQSLGSGRHSDVIREHDLFYLELFSIMLVCFIVGADG